LGLAVVVPGLLTVTPDARCRTGRCHNRPPRGGIPEPNPRAPPAMACASSLCGGDHGQPPPRVHLAAAPVGEVVAWHFSTDVARDLQRGATIRRIPFVLITGVPTGVMGASAALAQNPHFLFANNSIDTSPGALNPLFREVGLGTGADSVTITLTADATATYQ